MCRLVQVVCTKCDEEVVCQFVFDIFADFQTVLKRPQIKDFCEIFMIPLQEFGDGQIKFNQFYTILEDNDIVFDEFECLLPSLLAMIGLTP